MADAKKLARIHRVRTLQLGLVRADEMRAHERVVTETALAQRIGQLAAAVSPAPMDAGVGVSMAAAAYYRDRLNHSAAAADARVRTAESGVARATDATRAAQRDQTAVEKLMERAKAAGVLKEMRALEDAPQPRKRHDPC